MLINGRDIKLIMYKNYGNRDYSDSIEITSYIKKDGISSISKTVDQMFKIDNSNLSVECKNIKGSLWNYINTNLDTTNALYPPWVLLTVDSVPQFLGLVDLTSLNRDCKNEAIKISAQDWSKQLTNNYLTSDYWQRKLSVSNTAVSAASYTCKSATQGEINYGYGSNVAYWWPVFIPTRVINKVFFDDVNTNIKPDMKVSIPYLFPGKIFTVSSVKIMNLTNWIYDNALGQRMLPNGTTEQLEVTLEDGFAWPQQPGGATNFSTTRLSATINVEASDYTVSSTTYEEILQDYPVLTSDKIHRVRIGVNLGGTAVTMVNRLQVGDRIKIQLSDQSYQDNTIVAIDYFTKEYVLQSDLSGPTYKGANVFLNDDDLKTVYHHNAKDLILNAVNDIANVDFTRFTKPTLSKFMFSSLGVPYMNGEPCISTNIDVNNSTFASQFSCNKNIGYSTSVPKFKLDSNDEWVFEYGSVFNGSSELNSSYVTWSDQLLTAPSKLMPNALPTYFPSFTGRLENKIYMDSWYADFGSNQALQQSNQGTLLYDYSCFRLWKLTPGNISYSTFTTSYSGMTSAGTLADFFSAAIFKDIACSLGTGYSVITVDKNGVLAVHNGTVNPSITDSKYASGILRTTPYGTYIITKTGYGKIKYTASTLSVDFCSLGKDTELLTLTLLPNMFAHLNSTTNYLIGIFTNKSGDTVNTEARLLELKALPNTDPTVTLLSEEKIFNFVSSLGRMEKDPVTNKLLLVYDGRAYQISNKMSLVIERLKADGMNSLELIEYVCQILGAMAIPNARGTMDIVSVNYKNTPLAITTGIQEKTQNRLYKYFFSVIRINGFDDSIYADAFGYDGTQTFEMSSHPLLFSTSQCAALADNLVQFYGVPRREEVHSWKNANAFHENLDLFQILTLNGDTKQWYLTNISFDIINKKATAKLLEVI